MKHLLIIEPGFELFKRPIVESLAQTPGVTLHFASGLSQNVASDWAQQFSPTFLEFSYRDNSLLQVIGSFQRKSGMRFDGVFTYIETSVHFTNCLQHDLGLPVVSTFTGKQIRNKGTMRHLFCYHGVSQPKSLCIAGNSLVRLADLRKHKLQFPLVIKPTELMASLGVIRVENLKELNDTLPRIAHCDFCDEGLRDPYGDISTSVLVEEYIEGDEYSLECYVVEGQVHLLGITKKIVKGAPYFDEVAHTFPAPDINNELKDVLFREVCKSHRALKLQNCFTHSEFRI
jgi:hypothetical protein